MFACIAISYAFCQESLNNSYSEFISFDNLDEKSQLYKIGHKVIYEWRCDEEGQCRQPSFKCDSKKLNDRARDIL